ncbi:MAG: bifunctional hydroxymethylpyrimidine kinase/phosphomethylpyrimidine kinase [Rhizobiaceae bacterium]|nr:bifunctional hydroxymethylpyrimidine kinase/phosphomethylpyrimidine kinase [Rhizobiaceae bacterium]
MALIATAGAPHVLVIAGSDSSGGAGIARDIETVAAFGIRSCVSVTAVTAQTHTAVTSVEFMPARLVAEQISAAFATNRVAAVKIGMLGTASTVAAVVSSLQAYPDIPIVLDPVLASTSGRPLLESDAIVRLKADLMPLCTLLTPNLNELGLLCDAKTATSDEEVCRQAQELVSCGVRAVLVKGGHAEGRQSTDILFRPGRPPIRFDAPRLGGGARGTGCMLASAIGAGLAQGLSLEDSVRRAKRYVFQIIERSADKARAQVAPCP